MSYWSDDQWREEVTALVRQPPPDGEVGTVDPRLVEAVERYESELERRSPVRICGWCGLRFSWSDEDDEALAEHLLACEKHPLVQRAEEAERRLHDLTLAIQTINDVCAHDHSSNYCAPCYAAGKLRELLGEDATPTHREDGGGGGT